jgi:TetR/AcrR family transcriptional regulator, cholesterol catabolism regulator
VATLQREGILQAATRLFSEKGYRGTSMRDLGQALGLHAGSLYVHIKSKEEVLFEICDRIQRVHTEGMAEILASEASAIEKLRAVARLQMRVIGQYREAAAVYFHEWRSLDPEHQAAIVAQRDYFEASVRGLIADCVAEGCFRPLDDQLAAVAFVSVSNWSYQWFSPGGRLSDEEVADRYVDFFLNGFQKNGSPS